MFDQYNGYKNFETWNVLLNLENNHKLYNAALRFMDDEKKNPTKGLRNVYRRFIQRIGFENKHTIEGVDWLSSELDYDKIDEEMREEFMTSMTRYQLGQFLDLGDGLGVITKTHGMTVTEYWFFPNISGQDTISKIIDLFGKDKNIEMFEIVPYSEILREVKK